MKLTLKDLIELAGNQARRVMIRLGHDLMPTWLLIDEKGEIGIVGTPWRDNREKRLVELQMRKLFRERRIVAYSVVVEAWAATKPLGWNPGLDYQGVAKEPDRREVVMAIASDGNSIEHATWAVQRDWNEQVRALEPIENPETRGPLEGWMAELLKP